MKQASYALKNRLLIWISIPVMAAGLIISILAFLFSWYEIEEVYDAQLVHSAKVLLQMTEHEIMESGTTTIRMSAENTGLQHRYENKLAFRIWHKDRLVMQSPNTIGFGGLQAPPGFSNQEINGKPWRFFTFADSNKNIRVETAERYAIRYELIGQLMSSLIIPAILFVPVILGIIWLATQRSLRPLVRLSTTVDSRHSDDLTAIEFNDVPREILPLVQAMNRLFLRLSESFRREREFTDHAAHELRTPLAAMKTQTQVLMKKSSGIPDLSDGLANLNATIDRAAHLVDQLLSFARLQNETIRFDRVDLSECLNCALDDVRTLANAKGQEISSSIADGVIVAGHGDSISILFRNLLDNAIKYTPRSGKISLTLTAAGMLEIRDSGPGIPDHEKHRVFQRFARADKTGQIGSGLGLAIAEWIAKVHGISILMEDNQPSGLIVRMQWNPLA